MFITSTELCVYQPLIVFIISGLCVHFILKLCYIDHLLGFMCIGEVYVI